MVHSRARQEIIESYTLYHHYAEFHIGLRDYETRHTRNPYDLNSVSAQSWDRGYEAGMRISKLED